MATLTSAGGAAFTETELRKMVDIAVDYSRVDTGFQPMVEQIEAKKHSLVGAYEFERKTDQTFMALCDDLRSWLRRLSDQHDEKHLGGERVAPWLGFHPIEDEV